MIQAAEQDRILYAVRRGHEEGCDAFGYQFCQVDPAFRDKAHVREVFAAMEGKPVYVTDYRTSGNPAVLSSILQYNGGRLNAHDIRSFCETRAALDPMAAELAVERATEKDLEEWGELLERLRREEDRKVFCVRITEFIYRMYRMSDNFLLTLLYHCTMEPQQRMYQQFIEKNGTDAVVQNAEEVFRYVSERNAPAAAACMRETMRLPLEGETAII
jgi:DNA-binding FadR family transcriptional regulator